MIKFLQLCFFISACQMIFTIDLPAQPTDIHFERFSIDDGLSKNSVTCIFQDSPEFMWMGTFNGLNRYDGYRFTIFRHNPKDSTSLSNNQITAIYETSFNGKRALWIGTTNGLNRFDPRTQQFARYMHDPDDTHTLLHN